MKPQQENPFMFCGQWYWRDEKDEAHGPYVDQMAALRGVLNYVVPPWWKRWWLKWKEFLHDNSGRAS